MTIALESHGHAVDWPGFASAGMSKPRIRASKYVQEKYKPDVVARPYDAPPDFVEPN